MSGVAADNAPTGWRIARICDIALSMQYGHTANAGQRTEGPRFHPLKRADLDDFVACYSANDRTARKESERWKSFTYDESLEDSAKLPDPDVLALKIVEDLEAALEQFAAIAEDLKK